MSTFDDAIERSLVAFVRRLSGPVVTGLAALLYGVGGLAVPLVLGASPVVLATTNFAATIIAGLLALTWLSIQVQAARRRQLVNWTTNLRLLTALEFEWLVGEVFRRQGWEVREVGKQGQADGNIDLVLVRDKTRKIVQCKRWQSYQVGVNEVRGFAGTLMREGLRGDNGVFVTLSDFTEAARREAAQLGMTLLDNGGLHDLVEGARQAEPCPNCRMPMRLDRSLRGWWLRCVQPGCAGKRDLGTDPGRAAELLIDSQSTSSPTNEGS